MLCFAGSIWLIAWYWTPSLLNPVGMAVVLAVLWFSVPFQYAMTLMQTHVLFFAMTLGALILAEKRRPGWAGLLLAWAAAVKLTPGVIVVYWTGDEAMEGGGQNRGLVWRAGGGDGAGRGMAADGGVSGGGASDFASASGGG